MFHNDPSIWAGLRVHVQLVTMCCIEKTQVNSANKPKSTPQSPFSNCLDAPEALDDLSGRTEDDEWQSLRVEGGGSPNDLQLDRMSAGWLDLKSTRFTHSLLTNTNAAGRRTSELVTLPWCSSMPRIGIQYSMPQKKGRKSNKEILHACVQCFFEGDREGQIERKYLARVSPPQLLQRSADTCMHWVDARFFFFFCQDHLIHLGGERMA